MGRATQRLRTPPIPNPPETWIRIDGAFEAAVPREVFNAAARVRRFNEKTIITERDLLKGLAAVLKREGRLTAAIINHAPDLPSANTVDRCFGTLTQAYERLGYVLQPRYVHHAVDRALKAVKQETEEALRMAPGNEAIRDFRVIPRGTIAQLPLLIKVADDQVLDECRYGSLAAAALALSSNGVGSFS